MINRRDFLGLTAGAGAAMTFTPELLRALQPQQRGMLMQRAIPSSGEMLPVISYSPRVTDGAAIKEILKTLADNGGRVVDVLHGGPPGEQAARQAASELGIQDRFFWTTPLSVSVPVLPGYAGPPLKPDANAVRAAMEEKFTAFKVPMIDLVMVGTGVDIATHLGVLNEMKKQGRIRYIGVHHLAFPPGAPMPPFGQLESVMRNEQIDFIGTDYSAGDRRLEEKILPLAQERKIGVMAYFPFDRGRLFKRVGSTPLPEWAAEFDAKTWAQFFLKYVLSHPAVTVAREGTTNAAHMLDNIGGGIGRLPNDAMRKRMADFVDALPPTPPPAPPKPQSQSQQPPQSQQQGAPAQAVALSAAILDRYVGEYNYVAAGQVVTFRRDGDRLLMKISGNVPEVPVFAVTESRFRGPFELIFDFAVDGQGKVTGAIVEQGPYRIPLERK
jgi:aryl-alcohol dehydrogenase-like predicted oxidoreductase